MPQSSLDIFKLRDECKDDFRLVKSDSLTLFLREWKPETQSGTAILIFHGVTAHSKPYEFIGKPLSHHGYHVFGLDLRGHGLSEGPRGDYYSYDQLLGDLKSSLLYLNEEFDRIIILGHSVGVLTGLFVLNEMPELFDGMVFLSAAREVREGAYPKRSIFKTLKYLISAIFQPSKPVIHYYRDGMQGLDDPLFNFYYTLRFLRIFSPTKATIPDDITLPLLFGIGDQDELFSIDSAKELFNEFSVEDKTFIVFKDAKHAEFPPEIVNSPLTEWLEQRFEK